jgi:16S rRNA (guanine527-N7)-methyltransferase
MTSDIILKYFPSLTEKQLQQFNKLPELYNYWNNQINVISRKDIDLLFERHVLHSLGIAKVMQFLPGESVLDVGTGGGFPGIPLAILFPETQFYLVDSIGKKIKVVQEVAKALELKNVRASHNRAE